MSQRERRMLDLLKDIVRSAYGLEADDDSEALEVSRPLIEKAKAFVLEIEAKTKPE